MVAKSRKPTFPAKLKALCEAKGWTLYKLGKEAGVDPAYVYALVDGSKKPSFDVALKLADALGCRLDDFR